MGGSVGSGNECQATVKAEICQKFNAALNFRIILEVKQMTAELERTI